MRNVIKRFLAGMLAFMMLMGATGCAKAADDLAAGSGAQTEETVVEPVEEAEDDDDDDDDDDYVPNGSVILTRRF